MSPPPTVRTKASAAASAARSQACGVIRHFFERDIESDPQTVGAIEAALKVLRKLGAKLVPLTLPPHQDWDACCRIILYAEAYAIHERDLASRPERYAPSTRARRFPVRARTAPGTL